MTNTKKKNTKMSDSVCKDLKWAVLDQNTRHHAHSQTSGYVRHNKKTLEETIVYLNCRNSVICISDELCWHKNQHLNSSVTQRSQWFSKCRRDKNWTLDIKYLSNNWKIRLIFTAEDLVVAAPEVCSFGRSAVDLIPVSSQNKPEEKKTLHNFSHSILHIQSYW